MSGIGGEVKGIITTKHELLGECLVIKSSPFNLVSWFRLTKAGFRINRGMDVEGNDTFTVTKQNVCHLLFRLIKPYGVYGCLIIKNSKEGTPFWTSKHPETKDMKSFLGSIIQPYYNQREIKRIERILRVHEGLSHCSDHTLNTMLKQRLLGDLTTTDLRNARKLHGKCQACIRGKLPLLKPTENYNKEREEGVIHVDIMHVDRELFLIGVDEKTGYIMVAYIKNKSKEQLWIGLSKITSEYKGKERKVKRVCSDREQGIIALKDRLSQQGISLYLSAADSHDSVVERHIRTIKNKARATLANIQYKVPKSWMKYLINYVVISQNLVPNNKTNGQSPYEIMTGRKIKQWMHEYAFGEVILARNTYVEQKSSMTNRASYGIVIGRELSSNHAYIIYDIESKEILSRRQLEHILFQAIPRNIRDVITSSRIGEIYINPDNITNDIEGGTTNNSNVSDNSFNSSSLNNSNDSSSSITSSVMNSSSYVLPESTSNTDNNDSGDAWEESKTGGERTEEEEKIEIKHILEGPIAGRTRAKYPVLASVHRSDDDYSICIENESNQNNIDGCERLMNDPYVISNDNTFDDPIILMTSISHALKIYKEEEVHQAIKSEIQQLIDTGTFTPCSKTEAMKVGYIPTIMLITQKNDNTIKARLVANGSMQDKSTYKQSEISSPTVRNESISILLRIAAARNMKVCCFDVKGAYLHSDLPSNHDVYVRFNRDISNVIANLASNVIVDDAGHCFAKLNKGLYGLLEAGSLWFHLLSKTLKNIGFQQCKNDPCIYKYKSTIIGIYVDDIICIYLDEEQIEYLRCELEKMFGTMKYHHGSKLHYRGLNIVKVDNGLLINQADQIEDVVKMLYPDGIDDSKLKATPSSMNLMNVMADEHNDSEINKELFTTIAAKTNYIAIGSRPDIKLVTSVLMSRVSSPTRQDMKNLYWLVSYLKKTINLSLFYQQDDNMIITAEVDASWICHPDFTGQSGYIIKIGNNVVATGSRKQKYITRSSAECEMFALENTLSDIQYVKNILEELDLPQQQPIVVKQDNKSAIILEEGGHPTTKLKHLDWRCMRIYENIQNGTITLSYSPTGELAADMLTKPLQRSIFEKFRATMLRET